MGLRRSTAPQAARSIRALLRSPAVPLATKRRIWVAAERYVSFFDVTELVRTRAGHVMSVSTAKMVERQVYYFGEWEPLFSRYLTDAGPTRGTFLDLGANIGYYSVLAAGLFDRVVAVEASPRIHARLADNVSANRLANVTALNVAIGAEAGTLAFYYNAMHTGSSSLLPGDSRVLDGEVRVAPLADILAEADQDPVGIAFIKLDVEGFEHTVLEQILAMLDRMHPALRIMLEYDPADALRVNDCLSRMRAAGFGLRMIQGPYDLGDYVDMNRRSSLTRLDAMPSVFCDLLLERGPAA